MVVAAAAPVTTAAAPAATTTNPAPPSTTATTTTKAPEPTTTTTTTTTTVAASPPEPTPIERLLAYARDQLGRPYRRGAAGPDAFDCSGLVRAAYLTIGVDLPHYSVTQASRGRAVDWRAEPIQPGDLVFMRGDTPVIDLGHLGLAISATEWIVASRPGQPVHTGAIPIAAVQ